MLEANVRGGPTMGQNEFDCARVCVVFTIIPLVFHSSFIKPVGHEYWPA